jgi:hypothetical protein
VPLAQVAVVLGYHRAVAAAVVLVICHSHLAVVELPVAAKFDSRGKLLSPTISLQIVGLISFLKG